MTIRTHNSFHLGDNLVVLHFLRKLALANPAREFIHAVEPCYIEALNPLIADVDNVSIIKIEDKFSDSFDIWKNAGAGTPAGGFWDNHPYKNNHVMFHASWFSFLANNWGLDNPITRSSDMLFDYPALLDDELKFDPAPCDVLVVNSQPCSGQLLAYDKVEYFDPLLEQLAAKGLRVVCTQKTEVQGVSCTTDFGLSVTDIGHISLRTRIIVGVATGPLWPTFNVWNQARVQLRLVLLGNGEFIDDLGMNIVQVPDLEHATSILTNRGIL